jgi:hypothetical protein
MLWAGAYGRAPAQEDAANLGTPPTFDCFDSARRGATMISD